MKVWIVGAGPGREDLLTVRAREIIETAQMILAADRLYESLSHLNPRMIRAAFSELLPLIRNAETQEVCVLVSGDTGFYSFSSALRRELADAELAFINGVSSLAYLCAKRLVPYEQVKTVSLHGRDACITPFICYREWVFVLTGGKHSADAVIRELKESGLGRVTVTVGENLSEDREQIITDTAENLLNIRFGALSVLLIHNPDCVNPHGRILDRDFIRGKSPMTKEDIRTLSIAALNIQPGDLVYDVGAGTGSVSVEMARKAYEGVVYAIEKDNEAIGLIEANKARHGAFNVKTLQLTAPEGLEALSPPQKVFIGGSTGRLQDILELITKKNPQVRIVINAVTLETLSSALDCLKLLGFEAGVSCVNIAKSQKAGNYHIMTAQNPVYIITAEESK